MDSEQCIMLGRLMGQIMNETLKIKNGKDIFYMEIHFKTNDYGSKYMIILEYTKDRNLQEYLKINLNHIN
ncbi:hypothetical protein Glove_78g119 [Diversispora epigaea]|uniref:Uncharacterized protein n=1 Tax=Diversispora epigaea TaxID=1348612 RepID=A0A397J9B2_9GLOM|nr:hypothetical protein Glove_78g119 [Diversispora epigaea]